MPRAFPLLVLAMLVEQTRRRKRYGASVILGLVWMLLTGCADRAVYEWNLKHAYVTPWTHLSSSDHEEIVRLISSANNEPIAGITTHPPWNDGSTVTVYTNGNTDRNEYKYWTGYSLKKENGKWRVTFHGDSSPIIAQLSLSEQEHKLEKGR